MTIESQDFIDPELLELPPEYDHDMDPYLRRLLLYCFSEVPPNDYPAADSSLTKEYLIKIDVRTYNLVSALARDSGKDLAEVFAEALDFFGNFLAKFDGKHYRETRYYL